MEELEFHPVFYNVTFIDPFITFKVGNTIKMKSGEDAVVTEYTDDYIVYKQPNEEPVKMVIKDFKFFKIKQQ